MALNLISGNGIVDGMGNYAMYNVGYPLFVLAPVFALFGEDILIARLLNALLGGLAVVLCYAIAKEAGAGKIGRLLAAALWALYLPASVYAVYLLKENL
jgi:4-amino-4-deoxy-L-arabinose transferase-like glycosyltransferase